MWVNKHIKTCRTRDLHSDKYTLKSTTYYISKSQTEQQHKKQILPLLSACHCAAIFLCAFFSSSGQTCRPKSYAQHCDSSWLCFLCYCRGKYAFCTNPRPLSHFERRLTLATRDQDSQRWKKQNVILSSLSKQVWYGALWVVHDSEEALVGKIPVQWQWQWPLHNSNKVVLTLYL